MKKYPKKIALLLLFNCLFNNFTYAQISFGANNADAFGLNIESSPEPNSQYANFSMSSYTGSPNINIPIYEIDEGGFKLPISLRYDASGIMVDQFASWVGLGWTLDAGGLITRNIRGAADDATTATEPTLTPGFLNYNFNASKTDIDNAYASSPNSYGTQYNSACSDAENARSLTGMVMLGQKDDTDPDIFSFNFNGHSGKFIFSQGTDPVTNLGYVAPDQHKILPIPYQDLKFNYTIDPSTKAIISFDVIDEQGDHYYFATYGTTTASMNYHEWPALWSGNAGGDFNVNPTPYSNTTWYISKIVTSKGKTINFSYVPDGSDPEVNLQYTVKNFISGDIGCSGVYTSTDPQSSVGQATQYSYRLTTIEGDDFKVVFNAPNARRDIPENPGGTTYALGSIWIYSKDVKGNLTYVKEFDLGQSYFEPNERLRLDSITETGEGVTNPATKFTYYDYPVTPQLPPIARWPANANVQKDFWGYFNNNSCSSLIPTIYIYNSLSGTDRLSILPYAGMTPDFTFTGADRTVNANAILAGTLNNITYPTGGSANFVFESNDFYYRNQTYLGGGIRLKTLTLYDGINHANDIVKNYTYTIPNGSSTVSSGILFHKPLFAYTINGPDYWDNTGFLPTSSGEWPITDRNYYTHNLIINSIPSFLTAYDEPSVGYSQITEAISGKGKTLSTYSTPARFDDNDDGASCSAAIDGYCDNLFSVPAVSNVLGNRHCTDVNKTLDTKFSLDLTGMYVGPKGYPFAPNLNYDWNRGLLMSKSFYDQSGSLVKSITNTYALYTPNSMNGGPQPRYIYGLSRPIQENYNLLYSSCLQNDDPDQYFVISYYSLVANVAKVLSSTTTKDYDQNLSGNYVQTTTNYTYSTNEMLPNKIETIASGGDILDKYINYPMDYAISTAHDAFTGGILNMQNDHIIDVPVETYTQRKNSGGTNTRVVDGSIIQYSNGFTPLPVGLYKLETNSPLTSFSPAFISSGGTINMDSHYSSMATADYIYDGNIMQITQRGNKISCTLWGYNKSLPVAQVTNAQYNDVFVMVAYTSFEEDDPNAYNWVLSSSPILTLEAKTGNYFYNLKAGSIHTNLPVPSGTYVVSFWGDDTNPAHYTINAGSGSTVTLLKQTSPGSTGALAYFEYQVTLPSTSSPVTLSTTSSTAVDIDELRLYPNNAQMTTYTYNKMVGITSKCDANNQITNYEYDGIGRLILVMDKDGNITKKIDYGIQQTE